MMYEKDDNLTVKPVESEELMEFCTLIKPLHEAFKNNNKKLLHGECHIAFDQVPIDVDNNVYQCGTIILANLNTNTKIGVVMSIINGLSFTSDEFKILVMAIVDEDMKNRK